MYIFISSYFIIKSTNLIIHKTNDTRKLLQLNLTFLDIPNNICIFVDNNIQSFHKSLILFTWKFYKFVSYIDIDIINKPMPEIFKHK